MNCDFECSFKRILPTEINLFFEKGKITIPYFFRPSKLIFSDDNNIENIYCNSFSYKYQFEKAFKDISSGVTDKLSKIDSANAAKYIPISSKEPPHVSGFNKRFLLGKAYASNPILAYTLFIFHMFLNL